MQGRVSLQAGSSHVALHHAHMPTSPENDSQPALPSHLFVYSWGAKMPGLSSVGRCIDHESPEFSATT